MGRLRQASLTIRLVRPVIKELAKSGLTQKELLGGPIEFTDLLWETPALNCDAVLDGAPLHMYFESRAPSVVPAKLYQFWAEALMMLRIQPFRVLTHTGWVGLAAALPGTPPGERNLWVPVPRGFPSHIDDYAGVMLSIECAHLLRMSGHAVKFVEAESDYYVQLEDGLEVGVRDGYPIVEAQQWDMPVTGMVLDLLRMPRGEPFEGCDYDLLAKLRSVAHRYKSKLPEYEGVDWALQTLRVLAAGRHTPEIQNSIKALKVEQATRSNRVRLLREAIEVAQAFSISDRTRVIAIRSLLVPEVLTYSQFQRTLFNGDNVPAAITPKAREKLLSGLEALLQQTKETPHA